MENNKYEFTGEVKPFTVNDDDGAHVILLQRIRSLVFIREDVPSGTIGGWVQTQDNLSTTDTCWIYDDAMCVQNARVFEQATVRGDALVQGFARVSGKASVEDTATISGHAQVREQAIVRGNGKVREMAKVERNGIVEMNAQAIEFSKIQENGLLTRSAVAGGVSRVKSIATMNPIGFSGSIFDVTISDTHICNGCISLPFAEWTRLSTMPKQDFVDLLMNNLTDFTTTPGELTEQQAAKGYDLLIRTLGWFGRLAQIYGRDVSGFTYIDKGYSLVVEPGIPDYRDPENKLDPMDVFE